MTDPQVRQLAEQALTIEPASGNHFVLNFNGESIFIHRFENQCKIKRDELLPLLAAFASHARREALREHRDALQQCADALKMLHPVMEESEPCVIYGAYRAAIRLLAEEKK